jgi:tetratricopeptide (TPR) repeat protein/serine/threonine protein kinase
MPELECVSPADLKAFLVGDLPEPVSDVIARHLESCAACEAAARRLDTTIDPLIGSLRRVLRPVEGNGLGAATVKEQPPSSPEPSSPRPDELPRIAGYEVGSEIGRGGMGVVLRVHDLTFQRPLAVKVLLADRAQRPELTQRFLEEAQVMGQLQHPGIAPIHSLGWLPDGRPYFTMKLIQGQTLAEFLRQRPSSAHELPRFLAIFGQLCQAVAYAHSRGILHRDLKPSNVMVGAFGEVQVMDWGLAKVLPLSGGSQDRAGPHPARSCEPPLNEEDPPARAALSTQTGEVLGTPAYMAPEQARGEIDRLDERCDVFGLGAVLCVLLTGQPPYLGGSSAEVYSQAARGALEGAYARLDACGADAELVALARACLAKERAERPRHAGIVAEAVAAYQAQVQEKLRQAEVARAQAQIRAAEERKRRRLSVAVVVLLLVLLAGGGGFAWWSEQQQAQRDKDQAVRRAQARSGVELALQEALGHADRARTLVHNPASWQTTLAAARSDIERARGLLEQEPDLAAGGLAERVELLRARLGADEKDWKLLAVYDRVRLGQSQWDLERRRFKQSEAYLPLKEALADYGLPIGALAPGAAAARLRQRPAAVQPHLRAVLEECLAWVPKGAVGELQWLESVLIVDADPWLVQWWRARGKGAWAEVEKLAAQVEPGRHHPAVLVVLARNLPPEAKAGKLLLLRRTQQEYPGDFWVNFDLGGALYLSVFPTGADRPTRAEELPLVNEAVAFLRVAVGLCPGSAPAHGNLGNALAAQGDLSGAIACHQKALDLNPKLLHAHYNLGNVLKEQGDLAGAIACYTEALKLDARFAPSYNGLGLARYARKDLKEAIACFNKALELDPKFTAAYTSLGAVRNDQKDWAGAIACFKKALELEPKLARAHYNLGNTLREKGEVEEAITCFKKALDLDPNYARAHNTLGAALADRGNVSEAIACYRTALDLDPKLAQAHFNLGVALRHQGDVNGAITHWQKALDLDPKDVKAHTNLGNALAHQGKLAEAIACYQRALDLDPRTVNAHGGLGRVLLAQGRFMQARDSTQRALDLLPASHPLRKVAAQQLQECQRLLELDVRLTSVLNGGEPTDAAEQLALADLCRQYRKRYAAAARFYQDAFAAGVALTPQRASSAARAAVLASVGEGDDAAKLDPKDRARLRRQARDWLRDALKDLTKQLPGADAKGRQALQQTLRRWQTDANLASVRDKEALAKLPPAERAAWQQLWADVTKLLK